MNQSHPMKSTILRNQKPPRFFLKQKTDPLIDSILQTFDEIAKEEYLKNEYKQSSFDNLLQSIDQLLPKIAEKEFNEATIKAEFEKTPVNEEINNNLMFNDLLQTVDSIQQETDIRLNHLIKEQQDRDSLNQPTLTVISNGNMATTKSIYLTVNNSTYLFNCGESIGRNLDELGTHRFFYSNLKAVLLTYKSFENVGGIMTLLFNKKNMQNALSQTNEQTSNLKFIAPFDISSNLHTMNRMLQLDDQLGKSQHLSKGDSKESKRVPFTDENISVEIIRVELEQQQVQKFGDQQLQQIKSNFFLDSNMTHESVHREAISDKTNLTAYSYICTINEAIMREFNECCDRLDVPLKLRKSVKRFERVKLPTDRVLFPETAFASIIGKTAQNGKLVRSLKDANFHRILIIDLPSIEYIDSLEKQLNQNIKLDKHFLSDVDIVIHLSKNNILTNPIYDTFLQSVGLVDKNTSKSDQLVYHIYLDENVTNLAPYQTSNSYQVLLNLIHNDIFPNLPSVDYSNNWNIDPLKPKQGKSGMSYTLDQSQGISIKTINNSKAATDFSYLERIRSCLSGFNSEILTNNHLDKKSECSTIYPETIFLGTSSSRPTLVRNSSAILVNTDEQSKILMDCGAGTITQFMRFYGNLSNSELVKVKAIFISHHHSDHHFGVQSFVQRRKEAFQSLGVTYEPVYLCIPFNLFDYYTTATNVFYTSSLSGFGNSFNSDVIFLNNKYLMHENSSKIPINSHHWKAYETMKDKLKLSLETIPVIHASGSTGLILTTKDNYKLVYTGDTSDKHHESFLERGKNCQLLIHEATYHFDTQSDTTALLNYHSTVAIAARTATKLKADNTILTHFKNFNFNFASILNQCNYSAGIAFDFMKVNRQNINQLPKLNKAISFLNQVDNFLKLRQF